MFYYILIFLLLIIIEMLYFKVADKFSIIDKPNERSSHSKITIRGGGIIFTAGIILYAIFFNLPYPWFILGLVLITIVSFIDDTGDLSSKIRIVIHFISILLMLYQLEILQNYPWIYILATLIIATGIINAYNFMDGINGITGGYSSIIVLSFWFINYYVFPFTDGHLLIVILLSLLVFNFFNFRKKAHCFAGDVGSISISFILIFLVGQLIIETQDLGFIIVFGVYGVDSILTIVHRLMLKENIFKPHRKHVYQLLCNELNVPHILTSFLYMSIQVLIIAGWLLFWEYAYPYRYYYFVLSVFVLIILYILFKKKYYHLHSKKN
ncbi:MAG: glycosyltransferase family 4 protein [Candidatus Azobacteroides sp.]|nr:glycosyltransferase family 4 protein [Candidatus Azobacteroides sp.]